MTTWPRRVGFLSSCSARCKAVHTGHIGVDQEQGERLAAAEARAKRPGPPGRLPRQPDGALPAQQGLGDDAATGAGCRPRPGSRSPRNRPPPRDHGPTRDGVALRCEPGGEAKGAAAALFALDPDLPPIRATRLREIARPSPVPPYLRVVEPSACTKGSKILATASGRMPTPVSDTAKCSTTPSSPSAGRARLDRNDDLARLG